MAVLDRPKARAIAIILSAIAAVQIWPNAAAVPMKPPTVTKDADANAPHKKAKKKKTAHAGLGTGRWQYGFAATNAKRPQSDPVDVVLAAAHKQLGKPYRWAAVGPNAFDCSGFTMYVWQKAGVSLPHNSGAQRGATKAVSLDKMKPGDLIFSSGHVGLYIGKGKMIHAPRSGRHVEIAPIHSRAYGAGRPLA
jgi:cell wall-associated NlpC family hydrolase